MHKDEVGGTFNGEQTPEQGLQGTLVILLKLYAVESDNSYHYWNLLILDPHRKHNKGTIQERVIKKVGKYNPKSL